MTGLVPLPPIHGHTAAVEPELPLGEPASDTLGRTVLRRELYTQGRNTLTLAGGARLVHVGIGRGDHRGAVVYAWFDGYTGPPEKLGQRDRHFRVYRTGEAIPLGLGLEYRGTAYDPSYTHELHVYEEIS